MSEMPTAETRTLEHRFGSSSPWSLGIEEEFQLMDAETLALVPRVDTVLGHATPSDRLHIKHELMQSVVEIATPPCADLADARIELSVLRDRVRDLAASSDCAVGSAGTHPFSRYELQQITDAERYHQLVDRLRWIAQRELIFGMHVHVGMPDAETATLVFNRMRTFLPHLLALSANSPFWQGRDTGLASTRSAVFASFPRSGIPPSFESWGHWESFINMAMSAGAVDDYTYFWWDIRPHPRFGTIEVRIADGQTSIDDTLALAAVIQALAASLAAMPPGEMGGALPDVFLLNENKWSALRDGLDGEFIDVASLQRVNTRLAVQQMLDLVTEQATELGTGDALDHARVMLGQSGADRQRAAHRRNHDLRDAARSICI